MGLRGNGNPPNAGEWSGTWKTDSSRHLSQAKPGPLFVCIPGPIATNCSPTDTCVISKNLYKTLAFGIAMYTHGIHILSRVLFARAF